MEYFTYIDDKGITRRELIKPNSDLPAIKKGNTDYKTPYKETKLDDQYIHRVFTYRKTKIDGGFKTIMRHKYDKYKACTATVKENKITNISVNILFLGTNVINIILCYIAYELIESGYKQVDLGGYVVNGIESRDEIDLFDLLYNCNKNNWKKTDDLLYEINLLLIVGELDANYICGELIKKSKDYKKPYYF